MTDVVNVIKPIDWADQQASDELLPVLYGELRRLAADLLSREPAGQTLEATALVHAAYIRLVDAHEEARWNHRGHFFAAAAEAMRRILVEQARRKRRLKHGGKLDRVEMDEARLVCSVPSDQLLALDEALERLGLEEPEKARLVKLRFFAGMSIEEAAEVLGISRSTACRNWTYARAWLHDALASG